MTSFSYVFVVIIAGIQIVHDCFIFKVSPKHGGLNANFNGAFSGIYSLYITMQIVVMRTTPSDRGWRSILTLLPTLALMGFVIFNQPYYHFIKNAWIAVTLNLYWWMRWACELGLINLL